MKKKILKTLIFGLTFNILSCTDNSGIVFERPSESPSASTLISPISPNNQVPISTSSPINNFSPIPSVIIQPTPIPIPFITPTPIPTPLIKTNNVLFDNSKSPFGLTDTKNINILSSLKNFLTVSTFNVSLDNFNTTNLDTISTIVIFCPSIDYSNDEINKLSNFVKNGGKLVITGEWGGFGSFNDISINLLLKQANLKINEDVIKETVIQNYNLDNEQLIVRNFIAHPVTNNLKTLSFYSSSSVSVIDGGITPLDTNKTQIVAFSGDRSFTIKDNLKPGLIAVSSLGNGKIIVIGDSSLFTDKDTDKNGKINLNESDNKSLILNILNW